MRAALIIACAAILAGCDTMPKQAKVGVRVDCKVQMPEKPVWATEALPKGASFYDLAKAALAELKQRQAYETKLEAAARACS